MTEQTGKPQQLLTVDVDQIAAVTWHFETEEP